MHARRLRLFPALLLVWVLLMTVAVDVLTDSNRTGTTDPWTFSHAGGASPKGVLLFAAHGVSSTDHISSVTYGGVAMTRIQSAVDTVTEPARMDVWFLGAGVPTGTQTVSVDLTSATAEDFRFTCITLTGADDLEVVSSGKIEEDRSAASPPQLALTYAGRTCMAFCGLYWGDDTPLPVVLGTMTEISLSSPGFADASSTTYSIARQTTAGSSDYTIGYTVGQTDDTAFVAVAISEIAAGGLTAAQMVPAMVQQRTPAGLGAVYV